MGVRWGVGWMVLLLACGGTRGPDGNEQPLERPRLVPDPVAAADALVLERHSFSEDSCEVRQGCVDAAGDRLLLRLAAAVSNLGKGDFALGDPGEGAPFADARCGQGPILPGLLGWSLLNRGGTQLLGGGRVDVACLAAGEGFSCEHQGIAPGATDTRLLPVSCGAADLTGIPAGDYLLELQWDPDGLFGQPQLAALPITLPADSGECDRPLCGGVCCPEGVGCTDGRCDLPDLVIDAQTLAQSIRFDEANFGANDCAMEEKCVEVPGHRRLLRFTLSVQNVGAMPIVIGDPTQAPEAEWSACHEHYHMAEFATYRLLDPAGNVAALGHKQAFCLMDSQPIGTHGPTTPGFDCSFQGISPGWSDSYGSGLDCQWVDITDVPEGAYVLEVAVNGTERYPELSYENNTALVPVYIPPDPSVCQPRDEVCGDGQDQNCNGIPDDGCPPLTGNDSCESAHFLDGGGTWTGWIGAGTAIPPSSCGGSGGALYFSFTVLANEVVYLSTYGSSLDTVLHIEKDGCGKVSEVHCSDDGCGRAQSHFVGTLPAGSYRAVVQAKQRGATGEVKLNVQRSGCGDAKHMEGPGVWEGDTSRSQPNTMTSCGFGAASDDLWYFATCPGTTFLSIDSCGSRYDTVLELRKGSCRGRAVDCDDDAPAGVCGEGAGTASLIQKTLTEEGLWFLVVDGYLNTNAGPYRLEARW